MTVAPGHDSILVEQAGLDDIWHLSASTVGDALDKPQLNKWAIDTTAEYVIDQWDFIGTVRERSHLAAIDIVREGRFSGKDPELLGAAARGTEIHDYLLRRFMGMPMKAYPAAHLDQLTPYFGQCEQWLAAFRPEPELLEQVVLDPANGVGGRLDFVLTFPHWRRMVGPAGERLTGPRQLVDAKTSDKSVTRYGHPTRPFGDHALQLSTYFHATHVATWAPRQINQGPARFYLANPQELATAAAMPHLDGALILHVTPGHANAHPISVDRDVHRFALCAREAWRWLHHYSKGVVSGALTMEADPMPDAPEPVAVA